MQYMNPLVLEDLEAINDLAKLTWAWSIKYWTEKGLDHGSFIITIQSPEDHTWYRFQGSTIIEAVDKIFTSFDQERKPLPIPDYP